MATSKKSSPSKRKSARSKAVVSKASDAAVTDEVVQDADTEVEKSDDGAVKEADTKAIVAEATPEPEVAPEVTESSSEASPVVEPVEDKPTPTTAAAPVEQRSAFFPMVFGGIVAAAIGFFAAQYGLFSNQVEDPTAALRSDLGAQQERIVALEAVEVPAVDFSPLETQLADLDTRLKALEDRPVAVAPEGVDVDAITAAAAAEYAEELEILRASVEAQRGEIQGLLDNAISVEQATSDAAVVASAQTALAKIVSALDAGQPFLEPIADLKALDVGEIDPALDAVAADGVATLSQLQAEFPEQARTALAVARKSGEGEGQQGLGGFLKRSLGARSTAPREGSDPDAVLSRSEAAINSGDLITTLTELDTLPEDAQAAIVDWRAAADAHLDARKAADALAQRLTAD